MHSKIWQEKESKYLHHIIFMRQLRKTSQSETKKADSI